MSAFASVAFPTFSNLKKVVKHIAGDAVQNNLVLIIVPLFALLALAIIFVVIPKRQTLLLRKVFAGMVGTGSASVGLVSMSNTMASFAPIYGIFALNKAERIGHWAFGYVQLVHKRRRCRIRTRSMEIACNRGNCAICGPVDAKGSLV